MSATLPEDIDPASLLACRAAPRSALPGCLRVAVDAASDLPQLRSLATAAGLELEMVEIEPDALDAELGSLRLGELTRVAEESRGRYNAGPPTPPPGGQRHLRHLLAQAQRLGASDIHVQPGPTRVDVRLRVDGLLRTVEHLSADALPALCAQVKVAARLSLAERRLPQDGHMLADLPGGAVDLRVSILPGIHGEALLLRLPATGAPRTLDALGMPAPLLAELTALLERRGGLILVGGPTGSGKTTTLHAMMRHLAHPGRKLVSIEDPVETLLPGVTQVAVEPGGPGFGPTIRALLRHAPDVIMVGEIRDGETARASAEAALTGHLVVASVHARDAAETALRMASLGVPRHVTAAVLRAALGQRLLRRPCPACRRPTSPPHVNPGCPDCGHTGYRGRLGIFEFLRFTPSVRGAFAEGQQAGTLRTLARAAGMRSLADAAATAVATGETSPEEAAGLEAFSSGNAEC